jgi:hypothetical protein
MADASEPDPNRDLLRPFVREATGGVGLSPAQVAHVSGVPLADIGTLNREANESQ